MPWKGGNLPYKGPYDINKIKEIKDNIRIVYEKDNFNSKIRFMKSAIERAKRIFFLGFGYATENLDFLDIPNYLSIDKEVFGTAFDLYDNEIKKIKNCLSKNYQIKIEKPFQRASLIIEHIDCLELLRKHL